MSDSPDNSSEDFSDSNVVVVDQIDSGTENREPGQDEQSIDQSEKEREVEELQNLWNLEPKEPVEEERPTIQELVAEKNGGKPEEWKESYREEWQFDGKDLIDSKTGTGVMEQLLAANIPPEKIAQVQELLDHLVNNPNEPYLSWPNWQEGEKTRTTTFEMDKDGKVLSITHDRENKELEEEKHLDIGMQPESNLPSNLEAQSSAVVDNEIGKEDEANLFASLMQTDEERQAVPNVAEINVPVEPIPEVDANVVAPYVPVSTEIPSAQTQDTIVVNDPGIPEITTMPDASPKTDFNEPEKIDIIETAAKIEQVKIEPEKNVIDQHLSTWQVDKSQSVVEEAAQVGALNKTIEIAKSVDAPEVVQPDAKPQVHVVEPQKTDVLEPTKAEVVLETAVKMEQVKAESVHVHKTAEVVKESHSQQEIITAQIKELLGLEEENNEKGKFETNISQTTQATEQSPDIGSRAEPQITTATSEKGIADKPSAPTGPTEPATSVSPSMPTQTVDAKGKEIEQEQFVARQEVKVVEGVSQTVKDVQKAEKAQEKVVPVQEIAQKPVEKVDKPEKVVIDKRVDQANKIVVEKEKVEKKTDQRVDQKITPEIRLFKPKELETKPKIAETAKRPEPVIVQKARISLAPENEQKSRAEEGKQETGRLIVPEIIAKVFGIQIRQEKINATNQVETRASSSMAQAVNTTVANTAPTASQATRQATENTVPLRSMNGISLRKIAA